MESCKTVKKMKNKTVQNDLAKQSVGMILSLLKTNSMSHGHSEENSRNMAFKAFEMAAIDYARDVIGVDEFGDKIESEK